MSNRGAENGELSDLETGRRPKKKSNGQLKPSESHSSATKVYVSFNLVKLGDIDALRDKYKAVYIINARWIQSGIVNKHDPATDWNPKLFVENSAFDDIVENVKYDFVPQLSSNSTFIIEKRLVKGYFWERMEIENFPIDIQELNLVFASKRSFDEVELVQDIDVPSSMGSQVINIFVDQQKWKLYDLMDIRDKPSYDIQYYQRLAAAKKHDDEFDDDEKPLPKIVATCYCSRSLMTAITRPKYFIWNAYFLIFLITASTLNVFSMDCKAPQARLNTSFTILLTSVTFKWVTNRSLPTVSYLISLDVYTIVCILFNCLQCVWHSLVSSFWPEGYSCLYMDKYSLIAFSAVFVLIHLVLVVWYRLAYNKVRALKRKEKSFRLLLRAQKNRALASF